MVGWGKTSSALSNGTEIREISGASWGSKGSGSVAKWGNKPVRQYGTAADVSQRSRRKVGLDTTLSTEKNGTKNGSGSGWSNSDDTSRMRSNEKSQQQETENNDIRVEKDSQMAQALSLGNMKEKPCCVSQRTRSRVSWVASKIHDEKGSFPLKSNMSSWGKPSECTASNKWDKKSNKEAVASVPEDKAKDSNICESNGDVSSCTWNKIRWGKACSTKAISSSWGSKNSASQKWGTKQCCTETSVAEPENESDAESNIVVTNSRIGISQKTASKFGWGGEKATDLCAGNTTSKWRSHREKGKWTDTIAKRPASWSSSDSYASTSKSQILSSEAKPNQSTIAAVSFPMPPPKRVRKTDLQAKQSQGAPVWAYRENSDEYFLRWIWGGRVSIYEKILSRDAPCLEKEKMLCGNRCTLICVKIEENRTAKFEMAYVKAFYLAVSGPGLAPLDIQEELNKLGNFAALPPNKAASRLELLVSPAAWFKKRSGEPRLPCQFLIKNKDVEEIPDNSNLGCGFIPEAMLERLLGDGTDAMMAGAVQVRIISSSLGIFKGVLVRKQGITRIQLPSSMRKVDKPNKNFAKSFDGVYMSFNAVFPSTSSKMLERHLNPHFPDPPESSQRKLGEKRIGEEIQRLFFASGIPYENVMQYVQESCFWSRRNHAWCVGVADPTGGLPEGSVFLTGIGVGRVMHKNLFITRSPCTEKEDGKILPFINEQPKGMSDRDWVFLCSFHFGIVIFATPRSHGSLPIPVTIADGDLDGDLYFVCWDKEMVSRALSASDKKSLKATDDSTIQADVPVSSEKDPVDLLGVSIHMNHKGAAQRVTVTRKISDSEFVVSGEGLSDVTMTRREIMKSLDVVERIEGHRGTHKIEVLVLWGGGGKTWELLSRLRRDNVCDEVAEYALANNLLDSPGWKWVNDHIRNAEIVEVTGHRKTRNGPEVQILWDDGDKTWERVCGMKCDEPDLLASYAVEKNLLHTKGWIWAKKHLQSEMYNWFDKAQNIIADMDRLEDHRKLIRALHKKHKETVNKNDTESVLFGRAYKKSLQISKHGGRVQLPYHLHHHISQKYLHKYLM